MSLLVRIEGIDFAQTIVDTNDLSTQRGSGLAYIAAPRALIAKTAKHLGVCWEEVFTGASAGVYWLASEQDPREVEKTIRVLATGHAIGESEGSADSARDFVSLNYPETGEETPSGDGAAAEDELELEAEAHDTAICALWDQLRPVLPHLNFAVVAEQLDRKSDEDTQMKARSRLLARVREAQLRSPTVSPPEPKIGKWRPCRLNPNLPGSGNDCLSASVNSRRRFGRRQKRAFYNDSAYGIRFTLPKDAHSKQRVFARDLNDLVSSPPSWVKPAIRNKIAHVYMDGNSFTKLREDYVSEAATSPDGPSPLEAERSFSKSVRSAQGNMLRSLLCKLIEESEMTGCLGHNTDLGVFRWETLLWGGDEAAFVMPAWIALPVLRMLSENFSTSQEWCIGEERLTHKVGIYIADRKTPIAVARRIAEALADSAKLGKPDPTSDANVAQIMVTESADPPMDITSIGPKALADYRCRYFGCGDPAAFTLDLDKHIDPFISGLKRVKHEKGGLPRSQLYSLLRDRTYEIGSEEWQERVRDPAFKRSGATCQDVFATPPFGGPPCVETYPLLAFMRVAELLDYYCPEVLPGSKP